MPVPKTKEVEKEIDVVSGISETGFEEGKLFWREKKNSGKKRVLTKTFDKIEYGLG